MKHIKRKFLFHDLLNSDSFQNFPKEVFEIKELNQDFLKKNEKTKLCILTTDQQDKVFTFIYKNHGNPCLIPVPDFALVNYNFAYILNKDRINYQKELIENLSNIAEQQSELSNTAAYNFIGAASSCIINLYTSIECFVNDIIPQEFIYVVKNDKKTEIYDKRQIQFSISMDDKLKKVLPQIFNKNFFQKQTPTNQHIINLKDLRNEIIHIKSDTTGETHVTIMERLLKFKYEDTFKAVFTFFNFYRENFIEECPCGDDW